MSSTPDLGHTEIKGLGVVGFCSLLQSTDILSDLDAPEIQSFGYPVGDEVCTDRDGGSAGHTSPRFSPGGVLWPATGRYLGVDPFFEKVLCVG